MLTPEQKPESQENSDSSGGLGWVVTLLAILVPVFLITGFFPISHKRIDDYAVSLLQRSGAKRCSIQKVRLIPWKGLRVHGLSMTIVPENGNEISISLSKGTINCNLVTLLPKWKKLNKQFRNISKDLHENPINSVEKIIRITSQINSFKGIEIHGNNLVSVKNGREICRSSNFLVELSPERDNRHILEFFFSADTLFSHHHKLTHIKGAASYKNGLFKIVRSKGRINRGRVRLNGVVDLKKGYLEHFIVKVSDLDLQQFYQSMEGMTGNIAGKANVEIDLLSGPLKVDSLRGSAKITVLNFQTSDFPIQRALVQLLSIPQFSDLKFDRFRADMQIKQHDILLTEMSGTGEMLQFVANGWVQMDGKLNQEVQGELSETVVRSLSKLVVNSLESTGNSGRIFKCRMYGDFMNPKIELDKAILKRAVGSVFRNMKQNFQDLFKKNK